MADKKREYLKRTIEHVDITAHNVVPLVDAMQHMAFSARHATSSIDLPYLPVPDSGPNAAAPSGNNGSAVPPERILDHVADAVELSGIIEKRGDISVFKADLATLKRTE